MIVLTVIGKFGALFASLPTPIVGGLFCVMFGMIAGIGLSNMQYTPQNSMRNVFILGFALYNGLSIASYFTAYTESEGVGPVNTMGQSTRAVSNSTVCPQCQLPALLTGCMHCCPPSSTPDWLHACTTTLQAPCTPHATQTHAASIPSTLSTLRTCMPGMHRLPPPCRHPQHAVRNSDGRRAAAGAATGQHAEGVVGGAWPAPLEPVR
jgi:hypothetical protein